MAHLENPDIEAALVASPDDLARYEAYGRWLAERGDPRAELILLGCASERSGDPGSHRAREQELLEQQSAELRALAPSLFAHGWQLAWVRGFVRELTLRVSCAQDERSREQVKAILTHPHTRFLEKLSLELAHTSEGTWLLELIADRRPPMLERLFVASSGSVDLDPVGSLFVRSAFLGTYTRMSRFGAGPFRGVRTLDLRDQLVDWRPAETDSSWPDLEILVLRPRGNRREGLSWAAQVLGSGRVLPRLREVWACESQGDALLGLVLASPLLPQLRRLDFTDTLTNQGAELLYTNAERLSGVEEIWIGSTGRWRDEVERMARVARSKYQSPPAGELEIDGPWRSRLAHRFKKRVRFKIPAGHPHL